MKRDWVAIGLCIAALSSAVLPATSVAAAEAPGEYSAWKYHPEEDYFYARYQGAPKEAKHPDFCIYQPTIAGRCFFYDSRRQEYIGLYSYISGKFYPLLEGQRWKPAEEMPFVKPPQPPSASEIAALKHSTRSAQTRPGTGERGPQRTAGARSGGRGRRQAVSVVDDRFDPGKSTLRVGDTLTWTNRGRRAHSVTSDPESPEEFDSRELLPGQTFEHRFMRAGEFPYHDETVRNVRGTVTVKKRNAEGTE